MSWIQILKLDNVQAAQMTLQGPPDNNEDENYDLCCEHARVAAEKQLKQYGEVGRGVLASPQWRNYNCSNLRKELEMFSDMRFPGMEQVVEAWDKCAEMGGANELV